MLTSSKNLGVSYFSELNALDYCTAPMTTSLSYCHNALQSLVRIMRNEGGLKDFSARDCDVFGPEKNVIKCLDQVDPFVACQHSLFIEGKIKVCTKQLKL